MRKPWLSPPDDPSRYALKNVRIPPALSTITPSKNGWCEADVLIANGRIVSASPTGKLEFSDAQIVDADQSILLSGLVDCHTHLDKAHVASFHDFPAANLSEAIAAMAVNKATWTAENLSERVNFSLESAYAYGVRAMRSHVDFSIDAPAFIWDVMSEMVARWKGRIDLQLAPLANIVDFENSKFRDAVYATSKAQGCIGLFLYDQDDLVAKLTPIFEFAKEHGLEIDLHVDEGLDGNLDGLSAVAETALATRFDNRILCGHCVALNVYDEARRNRVIDQALEADLHFVSLPVTNLYLQGRSAAGVPQLRGMAPVAKLVAAGANVSLGADNVRDGFCAFGDFDPMAVLNLGAQIGHLHEPVRDWASLITCNPAKTLGLEWGGEIVSGAPADLVLFSARTSTEMDRNNAPERIVIRDGKWLESELPDFRKLGR